jgi:hypothetical protein
MTTDPARKGARLKRGACGFKSCPQHRGAATIGTANRSSRTVTRYSRSVSLRAPSLANSPRRSGFGGGDDITHSVFMPVTVTTWMAADGSRARRP